MTPAVVAAERAGIPFRLHEYEHQAGAAYGPEAAAKTAVDPARVFKTLVVAHGSALSIAIVPVAAQLDLRALGKRTALADRAVAERATGYVLGGISPLGQRSGCRRCSTSRRSHSRRSTSAAVAAGSSWSSRRPTCSR